MATVARGRLIFTLDATMSRQPTWDLTARLQAEMFEQAAGLEIQLVYFRGLDECRASGWTTNPRELANKMSKISCATGETQIGRILSHVKKEHAKQPISAVCFVGDACEEEPGTLYDRTARLPPLFLFQEGPDVKVEQVFRELARLTKGAYDKFDTGAAQKLGELLRAVAAFAVGGVTALADLRTDSARKLLTQLKP
jgi:hypothetical protein